MASPKFLYWRGLGVAIWLDGKLYLHRKQLALRLMLISCALWGWELEEIMGEAKDFSDSVITSTVIYISTICFSNLKICLEHFTVSSTHGDLLPAFIIVTQDSIVSN